MSPTAPGPGPAAAGELPRVTFFLFAYNQTATVREACVAALAQDYPRLEVVFSDDGSKDATFEIMEEVAASYRGPHALRLNRNARNLGLIAHVNEAMRLATGELLVAAAGDDVSLPERTSALVEAWLASGRRANSIHSSVTKIDTEGRPLGIWKPPILDMPADLEALALEHSLIIGASHAWSRRVFDAFGPITERDTYEDLVIAFRSLLLGPIAYVDRPLVRYRVGQGISAAPPKASDSSELRPLLAKKSRLEAATLAQRCADVRHLGRPVPRALAAAAAFEATRRDFAIGGFQGVCRALAERPSALPVILRAWLSTANGLRRARRRLATQGGRSGGPGLP